MQRFVRMMVIGIIILVFQLTIVDWIRIQNIRPDLLMLFILYVGYREGRFAGMLFGFAFGMLQDLTSASAFIGLAALSKTVVGFGAGSLRGKFNMINPLLLYTVATLVLLTGQFIYFGIYYAASTLSTMTLFFRIILPATVYTILLGSLLIFILPLNLQD